MSSKVSKSIVTNVSRGLATDIDSVNPKRLFVNSDLSERYAKYRPKLPIEHVETIVNQLVKRKPGLWLDVGCGPGTSTQQIIGYSEKIIGVDVSDTQVEVAKKSVVHPSISFVQGSCEKLPAADNSVDVITAVQAAHYFDLPAFFKEVDRCLAPGGYLCLIGYTLPRIQDNETFSTAYYDIGHDYLRPYLQDVLYRYLWQEYDTMELPYSTRQKYTLDVLIPSSYDDILGHLCSYSAIPLLQQELGDKDARAVLDAMFTEAGVTEVMKSAQHVFVHPCFMVAVQKPTV